VTVSKGWVTLRGEVRWRYQKRAAERTVRRLPGVRGVTNLITIRPLGRTPPEQLKVGIREALVRNARTDAERITVEVDGSESS
jgi:osmotically-inducible protein OsmY